MAAKKKGWYPRMRIASPDSSRNFPGPRPHPIEISEPIGRVKATAREVA